MKLRRMMSGFTVVEVAVIITVIAVITTLASVGYNKIQTQQEDVQRRESAAMIMQAAEKYYDQHGEYPYGATLNPTSTLGEMPDYTATKNTLPELTDSILTAGDSAFVPHVCQSTVNICTITLNTTQNTATPSQFTYLSPMAGRTSLASRSTAWGCTITTHTADPGAVVVWYEQSTSTWHFVRSKRGNLTIANYSTGPTAPTTCTFEYAS